MQKAHPDPVHVRSSLNSPSILIGQRIVEPSLHQYRSERTCCRRDSYRPRQFHFVKVTRHRLRVGEFDIRIGLPNQIPHTSPFSGCEDLDLSPKVTGVTITGDRTRVGTYPRHEHSRLATTKWVTIGVYNHLNTEAMRYIVTHKTLLGTILATNQSLLCNFSYTAYISNSLITPN